MRRSRGTPRSLLVAPDPTPTLFTHEFSLDLATRVQGYMAADDATIAVSSRLGGITEFALNEVEGGDDWASHKVSFTEQLGARHVRMSTDAFDDASLKGAVSKAEALAKAMTVRGSGAAHGDPLRPPGAVNPALWSDGATQLVEPDARLAAIEVSLTAAERAGVFCAGHTVAELRTLGVRTQAGHFEFGRRSTCSYSLTARTKDGSASGWAAWVGEDWAKANVDAIAAHAVDVALRSRNPVAVEPGRWTVVMSPEACGELVSQIAAWNFGAALSGVAADRGGTPFSKSGGGNTLGLKVMAESVTLSVDPMDPDGGFIPFDYSGGLVQFVPVTWVERGVLKTLSYPTREGALKHGLDQVNTPLGLRMSGGTTSVEEMIASTPRGIYVSRFSDVMVMSPKTLFMTGVTRDGTFLIEKGKITKPIKNLRFEDSPLFFLNNIEALGPAKRVCVGNTTYPYVMPAVKVRDCAFTSLTDAV